MLKVKDGIFVNLGNVFSINVGRGVISKPNDPAVDIIFFYAPTGQGITFTKGKELTEEEFETCVKAIEAHS